MGYSKESQRQNKVLGDLLSGKTPQKRIMVGYEGKTESGDKISRLSDVMREARMPMFCPKCSGLMTKRLDKKFWMKGYKSCFSCVQKEEHKIRLKGPDAWREYEQKKVRENALSWLRDQEQEFKAWKEYLLKEKKEFVNEDGSMEKWEVKDIEANKKMVKKMEKEFKEMKKELLKKLDKQKVKEK